MDPIALATAAVVLPGAVAVGVVAHELLHVLVLRAAGVGVTVRWLHGGREGRLGAGLSGSLASVRIERLPPDTAPWRLRVAALSPLALAVPLGAVAVGAVPDPFAGGHLLARLGLVGWLACALPSPSDFSVAFHAEQLVEDGGATGP